MTLHKLKIQEKFADAVVAGRKTFELRLDDRGYAEGDKVQFQCVVGNEPVTPIDHPINDKLYEITYILWFMTLKREGEGLQPNEYEKWSVFSIKEAKR